MSDEFEALFKEGSESSSDADSEVPESTADMILRAVSTLEKSGFENRWIADKDRHFFYDSNSRRLVCHTSDGKYLEYMGGGRYVPTADPTLVQETQQEEKSDEVVPVNSENVCWVTVVPHEQLEVLDSSLTGSKRQRTESDQQPKFTFNEIIENTTISGFKEFLEKWELLSEESSVRHLVKLDRQVIQYIMRRFNPLRAKPKNALLKFSESLLKHPQKWRIYSVIEEGYSDTGECETTRLPQDGQVRFLTLNEFSKSDDEFLVELDDQQVSECDFSITKMGSEFFGNNNLSGHNIFVDGMRVLPADSPYGPLSDGSVVSVPHKDSRTSTIPGYLLLIEIGKPEDLFARRLVPSTEEIK